MEQQSSPNCDVIKLTKKDFSSDQMVKWCPGCGDYAILSAVQTALPQLGRKREDFVFVSGIGCSSRFPYYMNTYGFHTIHGRAPAVATGVKVGNPNLDVWVVSGDGDSYSIGGNHFIHAIRRNVGLKYIVFNNQIYGLTKGQYSPTTKQGQVTKSSPYGSIDRPFNPAALALGAGCTFYARLLDMAPKELSDVIVQAAKHKGTALIEVLQNCVIFNDKTHANITDKELRDEHQLKLEHGKPMIFGKDRNKGIVLDRNGLRVETIGVNGITEKDILVHDIHAANPSIAFMISQMALPEFPLPLGIIRDVAEPAYEELLFQQIADVRSAKGEGDLDKLFSGSSPWHVE